MHDLMYEMARKLCATLSFSKTIYAQINWLVLEMIKGKNSYRNFTLLHAVYLKYIK